VVRLCVLAVEGGGDGDLWAELEMWSAVPEWDPLRLAAIVSGPLVVAGLGLHARTA
jgi:hypothetical protein